MKAIPATTYRCTLSDGLKIPVEAKSAAEAIEQVRRQYQGRTVVSCYSGLTEEDCYTIRRMDSSARPMPGYVEHDIPPHEAIPEGTVFPRHKRADDTIPMFDEAAIKAESRMALGKR